MKKGKPKGFAKMKIPNNGIMTNFIGWTYRPTKGFVKNKIN